MPKPLLAVAFACLAVIATPVAAQAGKGSIRVDDPWARRAVMLKGSDFTGTGAVYAVFVNGGGTGDMLVAAATDAADAVEIHETYQEGRLSRMRQVAGVDVPAGRQVELKPGGYHIMLINLTRDLKAGQTVELTLTFKNAGKIPVTAQIR
jgi:copper(I)-binding protein